MNPFIVYFKITYLHSELKLYMINERNKKASKIVRTSYFLYIPRSFINGFVANGFHRQAKLYGLNFITDMKKFLLDSSTLTKLSSQPLNVPVPGL